jgi:hypothetical protein
LGNLQTRVKKEGKEMMQKLLSWSLAASILILSSAIAFPATFTTGDLAGTWYGHQVVSGNAPIDIPRWEHGTAVVESDGRSTFTWNSPTETNKISTRTFQINPNGIVGLDNDPLIHGVMSDDKNLIVLIDGSSGNKGNGLVVFVKRSPASSFATGDLAGTWYGHQMVSGDAPAEDPRWGYGTAVVNSTGNSTFTWNSPTATNEVFAASLKVDESGIVGLDNDPLIHGVMNDDKNIIILIDGTKDNKGNGLMIFVKRSPTTAFTTGDLAGTWYGHQVVSGDAPADEPRWGYGTAVVTSNGSSTFTWNSPTAPNAVSTAMFQINANGVVGLDNDPLIHGVMSDGKNIIVLINGSKNNNGNGLVILLKRSKQLKPGIMPGIPSLLLGD